MGRSLYRTYCILRIVLALALPPGSAYCEDAFPSHESAVPQESFIGDGRSLRTPEASDSLARLNHNALEIQGKNMRVFLYWRFDEPRHVNEGTYFAPDSATTQAHTVIYTEAFNTMSRLFQQVAIFAQSIKDNIDRGIAPLTQSIGSGFVFGMHAPASSEPTTGVEYGGIFTEKSTPRFEPCFSITVIFDS